MKLERGVRTYEMEKHLGWKSNRTVPKVVQPLNRSDY